MEIKHTTMGTPREITLSMDPVPAPEGGTRCIMWVDWSHTKYPTSTDTGNQNQSASSKQTCRVPQSGEGLHASASA